jgi:hypothetical protein
MLEPNPKPGKDRVVLLDLTTVKRSLSRITRRQVLGETALSQLALADSCKSSLRLLTKKF